MKPLLPRKPERLIGLGIFAFALILRVIYLFQIKDAPVFTLLTADAEGYHKWAQGIAAGDWPGHDVFYQAPLYPYFLAVIYVCGGSLFTVRVVQIILGALSCVQLYRAGRRLFSDAIGVVAGILLAVYPTAIFFDCIIQKPVLDLFFMTLLLWLLANLLDQPARSLWFASGIALGCLALTRENALVFFAVIGVWLCVHFRHVSLRTRARWAGCFCLGLALVLFPVAMRNQIVGGEFHLTTSQFGSNFYIGNHERATGGYMPLRYGRGSVEFERLDATEMAEEALGRRLSPAEVSQYWTRKALSYISSQPGRWLRLMAKKCLLLWNALEITDSEDQYTYSDYSTLLRTLGRLLHFGIIWPLAVLGICLTWHERHRLWLLYAMILTYAAAVVMFYVFARYRFLLVPMLLLFGATGLVEGWRLVSEKRWRALLPGIVLMIAAAVGANWKFMSQDSQRASTYYNLAVALTAQGKTDAAIESYSTALRLAPSFAVAHYNLAVLCAQHGKLEEAGAHFSAALRIRPDWPEAHNNYGSLLVMQGNARDAVTQYREALHQGLSSPEPLVSLAWILATSPDPALRDGAESLRLARLACDLTGNLEPDARDAFAAACAENGRFDEAIVNAEIARDFANRLGRQQLAKDIGARIELYKHRQPYRQPR